MAPSRAQDVLEFWFAPENREKWFVKDERFDGEIRDRFSALQADAAQGALADWQQAAQSALALVILLDQFPRNMFRGTGHAFASDAKARAVADAALSQGFDAAVAKEVDPAAAAFFYLPFMHSEELADQDRALALYTAAQNAEGQRFAEAHRDIIARFGRFPHRNAALKRESTKPELAFLETHAGF
ncbi:DUF924 family protein [Thioclava sp. GXIMD4216]|uniref:DUF924 family protein n=1 Tax=Thioclava sp. GXIMD4216 TaxID=3131929 RepID=UPI0030D19076